MTRLMQYVMKRRAITPAHSNLSLSRSTDSLSFGSKKILSLDKLRRQRADSWNFPDNADYRLHGETMSMMKDNYLPSVCSSLLEFAPGERTERNSYLLALTYLIHNLRPTKIVEGLILTRIMLSALREL